MAAGGCGCYTTALVTLESWLEGGVREPVHLGGALRRIFVRTGGAGPRCTLLHGFPTSSYDWHKIWADLGRYRRLLAFDFLGFGDSDKPADHEYSIAEQADLTEALWARLGVGATAVVAHDYAVSVAQELLARQAEGRLVTTLETVVFLNGGLYPELHRPQPGQLLLLDPVQGPQLGRLMTEETFAAALAPTFAPARRLPADELRQLWLSVTRHDGHLIAHRLIRYIPDRQANRERWVGALERTPVPLHFVWGELDPVSGAHMADGIRRGRPGAGLARLADVGHWPHLEAPEVVLAELRRALASA